MLGTMSHSVRGLSGTDQLVVNITISTEKQTMWKGMWIPNTKQKSGEDKWNRNLLIEGCCFTWQKQVLYYY
jgi:hypothetical protein